LPGEQCDGEEGSEHGNREGRQRRWMDWAVT
jgi:hypothetical protein